MSVRRAQDERIEGTPDGNTAITEISDVPDAPTIGAVTDTAAGGTVTVAYTAAATGGAVTTFTATSTPGTITGTGASPITVTGLTDSTAYTFKVKGTNSTATGPESAASSSVTPTSWLVGAYDSIATVSLSSGANTVTFSSIPQTYTHLQIRAIVRTPGNASFMAIGTSSGANYGAQGHLLSGGNGGSIYANSLSTTGTKGLALDLYVGSLVANQFGVYIIDILDYANTTKYKTARAITGYEDASSTINFISHYYATTNAITSIVLTGDGNYPQYSHFALYGIKG